MGFLTKKADEFLALKTLRDKFGGLYEMKNFLRMDKMPPALQKSLKA